MYLLDDAVVSEWSASSVHFTIPPLVDQLTNSLQVRVPVCVTRTQTINSNCYSFT